MSKFTWVEGKMVPTKGCKNSADVARANGWRPGTYLAGTEGYGYTVIRITGIGERLLLAKSVEHDGRPTERLEGEGCWGLGSRDWHEAFRK